MPVHRIRRECPFRLPAAALGVGEGRCPRSSGGYWANSLALVVTRSGGRQRRLTAWRPLAQSNLHPGLRLRTRHRACDAYGAPIRRHESIRNGELRLGQPLIDTATNHVQCSRPHTFDVLRQVPPRPACRWALASRRLHPKSVRVTAWAAMAVLAGRHGGPPPGRRPARPRRHRHLRPWSSAYPPGSPPSSAAPTDKTGQGSIQRAPGPGPNVV